MSVSIALALPERSQPASQPSSDPLIAAFEDPPLSARPRVWWHWMNGNITQAGIKADLEWMHRVGIGGVQNFDASLDTPQLVDEPLRFMTPPWKSAFRYAVTVADRLGMEFAIAGSPGWSESGGPWVKPEQAMKKLVWSETAIAGGRPFKGVLPRPPSAIGPFQDVHIDWDAPFSSGKPAEAVPEIYRDVATVAYRVPEKDRTIESLRPHVTTSAGNDVGALLWDGKFSNTLKVPYAAEGQSAWIQFDFGHPQTIQAVSLALQSPTPVDFLIDHSRVAATLESSADGRRFDPVVSFHESLAVEETRAFAPVTARYFRLELPTPPPLRLLPGMGAGGMPPRTDHQIAEFVLHNAARVDRFEEKAAFFVGSGTDDEPVRSIDGQQSILPKDIIDLTSRVQADGSLSWSPPPGKWVILRTGYSLLGITNHPASPAGTGLEVDKLSRVAVKAYMDDYLALYEEILGKDLVGRHGLQAMVNDSWEAGAQNWTDDLPAEFKRRRGYDLYPWLPALTGRIIESGTMTERFLWDFRRTLGEVLTDDHYDEINASLHARNMVHYGESHESGRAFIGDGMDVKRGNDIPMGAMWVPGGAPQEQYDADIRESASVAHLYGQNLVAAESMTALGLPGVAFAFSPQDLKPTVDRELSDGLNRFVVHTSVHQPLNREGPGVTLGPFGQWFTREETWAEQAKPWVTYLSRSSHLLQQGHFVADVIYYYGQDSNITALYSKKLPDVPDGYAFDFANAHALTLLSVTDGKLVTASGMSYSLLALDSRARLMSMDVLEQIARLVAAGATVVGGKPQASPSLADDELRFKQLADRVWGVDSSGEHRFGRGIVFSAVALGDALSKLDVERDFSYSKNEANTLLWYVHRHLPDGDLYFVNNRRDRAEHLQAAFRVVGKEAEVWHADSGLIEPASFRTEGRTSVVDLDLEPNDAVFVVFRKDSRTDHREVPQAISTPLATVESPWTVRFQGPRGVPESATWTALKSWTADPTPDIKYFSGTATYQTTLKAAPVWTRNGQRVLLDLGLVKNVADVRVNGQAAGIAWKPPFVVDITKQLRTGDNTLTIAVTNLWPNRLIGDRQPNATPAAFSTYNPYSPEAPLLPSGLLGPVRILGSLSSTAVR